MSSGFLPSHPGTPAGCGCDPSAAHPCVPGATPCCSEVTVGKVGVSVAGRQSGASGCSQGLLWVLAQPGSHRGSPADTQVLALSP